MPNKVEQGVGKKILLLKQWYPADLSVFPWNDKVLLRKIQFLLISVRFKLPYSWKFKLVFIIQKSIFCQKVTTLHEHQKSSS